MITLFTIPKPFIGHIDIIQRNAIQSWLSLKPECEVILFGDEYGTDEIANEFQIKHISGIPCNHYGTPFLSTPFYLADEQAENQILCYVNTDIIFTSDLIKTTLLVSSTMKKYMIVGQRWNANIINEIDFENRQWEQEIIYEAKSKGYMSWRLGSDYFIFPINTLGKFEDFLVGRPGWDNWMLYHARINKIPVIDATRMIVDIHQNHGYEHVPYQGNKSWEGPEAEYNRSLFAKEARFTLDDSTHAFDKKSQLTKALEYNFLMQRIKHYSVVHQTSNFVKRIINKIIVHLLHLLLKIFKILRGDRFLGHLIYNLSR
jgi:hypothetical protein